MKALITGGSGFVGKYLRDELEKLGWTVYITGLETEGTDEIPENFCHLNILEQDAIEKLLRQLRPDAIFHLAAQSSVALSWKNPALTVDVNVKGAVNLLEAIRQVGEPWPRTILVGSGEEYGHILPQETPVTEENLLRPGNLYAATKAAQNLIGKIYAQAYGLPVILVRAFNHIGPGQLPGFVAADFCKQIAEAEAGLREPVMRVGNLTARRDFTDVRDVVRAYRLLAEKGRPGETYNVGSGHAVEIRELLRCLLSLSAGDIQAEVDPAKFRPVDVPVLEADIRKLQTDTGWGLEFSLEETLEDTLNYWRTQIQNCNKN